MKKYCSLLVFLAFFALRSYPAPTPVQIRQYAEELGVPAEALQQLVDAYHDRTGLVSSHAAGAIMLTLQELLLMRDDDILKIGSYYRVKTIYNFQTGRRVSLGDSVSLAIEVDFMVILPRYTDVDALFLVRADNLGRPRDLRLIEVAATVEDD